MPVAGTASAREASRWVHPARPPLHRTALPRQAQRPGQLPPGRVAPGAHLEQIPSSSNRFAHSDKCFSELCTGQRGVSGPAIIQTISYVALLPQGICKVWFSFLMCL